MQRLVFFSLMLMYNKGMSIIVKEELHGFTIIEVMLFLALSGFLLAGILVGANANIENQRYKDSVQDAVNALRDAYSFVSDIQVTPRDDKNGICGSTISNTGIADSISGNNSGRGRTSCAVYGAVVSITPDMVQTTELIGRDYHDFVRLLDSSTATIKDATEEEKNTVLNPSSADIDVLRALRTNNLAAHCNGSKTDCNPGIAGRTTTKKLKWSAKFSGVTIGETAKQNSLTLLIYRSPSTGAVRTLVMEESIINPDTNEPIDYDNANIHDLKNQGVYKYLTTKKFQQKDVFLCVKNDNSFTYAGNNRIIRIAKNAHSQTGVILENMDEKITFSGKEVKCN